MTKHPKRPAVSSALSPSISKITSDDPYISAEAAEQALEEALEAGDPDRILAALDDAPRWMRRQPELMLFRAAALMEQGKELEGFRVLREVEQKNPHFLPIYAPLAMYYFERDWPAHALQAAKRALPTRDLPQETRAALDQFIKDATAMIQSSAEELGLSFEAMQRADNFHERAQMAMDEDNFHGVESLSREAIKIVPLWNPPHNNRARALYFLGKTAEAITISEEVLARDAENTFALVSLVTFYYGVNQPEKAREYASRLGQLSKTIPADSLDIEQAVSALALMEDTAELWQIARRCLAVPGDTYFGRTWMCLAVAAIRSGKWGDALKLLEKVDEKEHTPAMKKLLEELRQINRGHPRLAWMPLEYPGADLLLHPGVIAEWEALSKNFSQPLSPAQKRQVDPFFLKYPFVMVALKRLLWEETGNPLALQVLVQLEIPEADAEILRFAFSQSGTRAARLQAIMVMVQSGRYSGPQIVRVWDEVQEDWREVELNLQQVGPIEVNTRPRTLALIEKAHQTQDPQKAISLLRQAVEDDPTSPIAFFNLGVMLVQNGSNEEGEAWIRHSVEVDPNYTYGHASIALTEANRGHEQEALDHLQVVAHAAVIARETAATASFAWADLAIQKHDLKSARQHLETAALFNPDSPLLESYQTMLADAEEYDKKFGFIIDFQRESARRAHQKLLNTPLTTEMGLPACLEMNTKDMLAACAHFWQVSSSGKKGEIVSRLAALLVDSEILQPTLEKDLTDRERAALGWLLEANGIRTWKEFVHNYGDDLEESTYWQFHEPQSIPGRLRRSGLFYTGTLAGQQIAFIPADIRPILRELLA